MFTNLALADASYSDMKSQMTKVQQSLARLPDPEGKEENLLYGRAKILVMNAEFVLKFCALESQAVTVDIALQTKKSVDKYATQLKGDVREIEDALGSDKLLKQLEQKLSQ